MALAAMTGIGKAMSSEEKVVHTLTHSQDSGEMLEVMKKVAIIQRSSLNDAITYYFF